MYHNPLPRQILFQGMSFSLLQWEKAENLVENDMICRNARVNTNEGEPNWRVDPYWEHHEVKHGKRRLILNDLWYQGCSILLKPWGNTRRGARTILRRMGEMLGILRHFSHSTDHLYDSNHDNHVSNIHSVKLYKLPQSCNLIDNSKDIVWVHDDLW